MSDHPEHIWIHGGSSGARRALVAGLDLPIPAFVFDAHRRRRGPYTFGGSLLRALVPPCAERAPGVVAAHEIEIRAAAVDLRARVAARHRPLSSVLPEDERILVPGARRTSRIANGIAEFVRDCGTCPGSVVVGDVHEADPTDRELLATLVRRFDPRRLTIVACSGEPPPESFKGHRITAESSPWGDPEDLAERYVTSDGTLDDPRAAAAYHALPAAERARLHDRRADELAATGDPSWALGAIPYHREHGGDPCGAGAEAVLAALTHCVAEGFLDAAADLARRGLRLSEPGTARWWTFTQSAATALAGLGRTDEARELYDAARGASVDPEVHSAAAYGTAMLDARHPDPDRRDLGRAERWINEAVAISSLLPDPAVRAFKLGFDLNGKALIEARRGDSGAALALVDEAIGLAERDLPAGRHLIHRVVLRGNRAQLLGGLGRRAEALAELDAAIGIDPDHPDHYLDRGTLLFRMGRPDAALADVETALRLSPPLPEAYYNRAQLLLALDDLPGARADLDRVLELDPGWLDAYVNRAGLLLELGLDDKARADVEAGLALAPGDPHLRCILGQLEAAAGRPCQAEEAFVAALETAPGLAQAWASRASLRYGQGDLEGAVTDLTRAVELGGDAAVHFNRAMALRDLGRLDRALDDLLRAQALDPADPDIARALAEVRDAAGDSGSAR
ncbi:tetratricopeptide repeat protein [Sphaerisporangium aureirubrum]|uniref:Tetratricopeptide repeat protein n=1 Tax=Sphaerisporangium aureirubrum TaxID=1544736 RepID=A0ABW1NNK6_9ACTN